MTRLHSPTAVTIPHFLVPHAQLATNIIPKNSKLLAITSTHHLSGGVFKTNIVKITQNPVPIIRVVHLRLDI